MIKKIREVTSATLVINKSNPPQLEITAEGNVETGGYSAGKLVGYIYIKPPADGIYDFDFVAHAPEGPAIEVISPISAKLTDSVPTDFKGARIHASNNNLVVYTEEGNSEKLERLSFKGPEGFDPFEQVTAEELEKLKPESDHFGITNAYIWEDVLHVTVRYGGGCAIHDFKLVWDGTIRKSIPQQADITIIHNAKKDTCMALITQELQFRVSSQFNQQTALTLSGWAGSLITV